jgi:hypothetical protein
MEERGLGYVGTVEQVSDCPSKFNSAFLRRVLQLIVTANIVSFSLVISSLKMGMTCSPETSVLTRPTRRLVPEHGILCSLRPKNLRSYIALTGWAL